MKITERFGFQVIPIHSRHAGLHKQWPRLHEHHNHWWRVLSVRVRPGNKSFRHFAYNENPTRALNTTSLKCCLPSTDAIDRREKIHACVLMFKVVSCTRASLKSINYSQKKRSDTFLTEKYIICPTMVAGQIYCKRFAHPSLCTY